MVLYCMNPIIVNYEYEHIIITISILSSQRANISLELKQGSTMSNTTANATRIVCAFHSGSASKLDSLSSTDSFDAIIRTASQKTEKDACMWLNETLNTPPNVTSGLPCNESAAVLADYFTAMCSKWDYAEKAMSLATKYLSEEELMRESQEWICSKGHGSNRAIQNALGQDFMCTTDAPITTTTRAALTRKAPATAATTTGRVTKSTTTTRRPTPTRRPYKGRG